MNHGPFGDDPPPHRIWDHRLIGPVTPRILLGFLALVLVFIWAGFGRP